MSDSRPKPPECPICGKPLKRDFLLRPIPCECSPELPLEKNENYRNNMKKTYIDECLERTQKHEGPCLVNLDIPMTWSQYGKCVFCLNKEVDFKIHSHTDVPELARRLKESIRAMRAAGQLHGDESLLTCADEVEASPEKK